MKSIISIILILLLNTHLFSSDNINRFGFLNYSNSALNFKDARDSLSNWITDLGVSNDLNVETKFFASIDDLFNSYSKGELDMIVISFPAYFENEHKLKNLSKDFWSASFSNGIYSDFYLITQTDSKINSIKDISNKSISLELYDKVPEVWIDKLSLLVNKKSVESISSKIIKEDKDSSALLNVFFKKTDLAVVSSQTWNDMIKLNPSISKKIKIIEKSEKNNLPFVGFFHKDTVDYKINEFFRITSKIEQSVRAEELITLLKFKFFFRLNDNYLNDIRNYYIEYFELKNRYK